jgi:hypothetical protein
MAYDTDNNVAVSGFSGEAVIATDYSAAEGNHFQVMKIAYGATGEGGTRVTSSNGLPVAIVNTPSVAVSSVSGSVTVTGTVSVNTHAVTATDLDIRTLTAGDPTTAGAIAQDVVRVVGYSGGWAVGVTATNFGIRTLTAGDPATAGAAGQDVVRIVGYSGGWAVGVTATDLDIRSLTYGSDSISVLNNVNVASASGLPFDAFTITNGFQTRLLRATSPASPASVHTALTSQLLIEQNAEDTVRVVGLSGAWPVSVFAHGLTNINNYNTKVPFNVDNTGALFVNLAAGSIGVTASVTGLSLGSVTISGISLGVAGSAAGALQIHGYNGSGAVLVGVSGNVGITGSAYTQLTTINTNTARVLGASGDYVGLTGEALTALNALKFTGENLKTQDASTVAINSAVSTINTNIGTIEDILTSTSVTNSLVTANGLKVDIKAIVQPTGGTANKVAIASGGAGTSTIFSSVALSSGVHFRSDLNNTGTIFIGFSTAVSSQGGFPLYNGDQIFIETDNLNRIHAWSTIAGATLYYIGT